MSSYTISIPDALYEKAQLVEGAFDEPFAGLPDNEQSELKAMTFLSDDALFTMMREQMPRAKQDRMSVLMDKNTHGTITEEESKELAALVEDGQRLILRKATAMDILMDRGYELSLDDMKPANE